MSDSLSKAILQLAEVHDKRGGEIADALDRIAHQLGSLGKGDAAGSMGAIEFLATQTKEGLETLGASVERISEALDRQE